MYMPQSLVHAESRVLQEAQDNLGSLIDLYLKKFDRVQTMRAYRSDLIDFFTTDDVTLDIVRQVSFVHVNQYIASLQNDGYKASTLKRRVAALRGFFDWLVALGVLEQNPAHRQLIRRIRGSSQKDRGVLFLSAEQAERLLDASQNAGKASVRNYSLLKVLLYCVLRRSEAASMDVNHIRPLGHYWVLDLPSTKGGADQYVKIPAHVVEQIEVMKAHYGFSDGPLWRSLSNNRKNQRLSPHSIYRIVKQAAIAAGLDNEIGAHTLRHTGCTLALEAGATLQQVQTHARHKNIETTMIYIHQRDKLRDSAADFIHLKG